MIHLIGAIVAQPIRPSHPHRECARTDICMRLDPAAKVAGSSCVPNGSIYAPLKPHIRKYAFGFREEPLWAGAKHTEAQTASRSAERFHRLTKSGTYRCPQHKIDVCASRSPRSAIISTKSRKLSLQRRYQRTHRMILRGRNAALETRARYCSAFSPLALNSIKALYPTPSGLFAPEPLDTTPGPYLMS
jgi:hypothetical protein